MEAGLELWLALLRHTTDYTEGVHNLFPRIPQMLDTDLDNLKQVPATSGSGGGNGRVAGHGTSLGFTCCVDEFGSRWGMWGCVIFIVGCTFRFVLRGRFGVGDACAIIIVIAWC